MFGNHGRSRRIMNVLEAAEILRKTPQFVRFGLRQKTLPIGVAVLCPGNRYSYHVSEELLRQYVGNKVVDDWYAAKELVG